LKYGTQSFILYEVDLGFGSIANTILFEGVSLAVVVGDIIHRFTEVEGEVKRDTALLKVPGLSAIVLHGCGLELTWAATNEKAL